MPCSRDCQAATKQSAIGIGASQRINLCENKMKLNEGYLNGLSNLALPNKAVMPRKKVRALRANSALWLLVAVIAPRASGSHTARDPAATVFSTERKSGAIPPMNGLHKVLRCA